MKFLLEYVVDAITSVAFAFATIAAFVFAVRTMRTRRQASIATFARSNSFRFEPSAMPESIGIYSLFPLMSRGTNRTITNAVLVDTPQTTARMFDYQFARGSDSGDLDSPYSVVYFESELLDLPEFSLEPKNCFNILGQFLGMQDISFDSHPKFSSAFVLHGTNEKRIRRFMTPERLSQLENYTNICIEATQSRFIVYKYIQVNPENYSQWLEESLQLFRILCPTTGSLAPPNR